MLNKMMAFLLINSDLTDPKEKRKDRWHFRGKTGGNIKNTKPNAGNSKKKIKQTKDK